MLWSYLRSKVRQSVLAGIDDALAEVEGSEPADHGQVAALLRERIQPALPARSTPSPTEANGDGKPPRRRAG